MGIAVPKMSAIVNRTTKPIDGMFNGQPLTIPAGYRSVQLPKLKTIKGKRIAGVDGQPDSFEADTQEPVLKNGEPVIETRIVGAGPDGYPLAVLLPDYAAEMVKRQNIVMGTEDPENFRDVAYLLGCESWGDDISPIEQTSAIERFDRSLMANPDARDAQIRGGIAGKRGRRNNFTDIRLNNPAGIRGDIA
jgi:hypothetical protein